MANPHISGLNRNPNAARLSLLARNGQAEDRSPSLTRHIESSILRVGEIQSLAMFATVDFSVRSPRLFRVAALLLNNVVGVEPALQVSPAELALLVLLVAGTLAGLLDLDFVMGKLRYRCCRVGSCQEVSSSLRLRPRNRLLRLF